MARYKVLQKSFLRGKIYKEGEEVDLDIQKVGINLQLIQDSPPEDKKKKPSKDEGGTSSDPPPEDK